MSEPRFGWGKVVVGFAACVVAVLVVSIASKKSAPTPATKDARITAPSVAPVSDTARNRVAWTSAESDAAQAPALSPSVPESSGAPAVAATPSAAPISGTPVARPAALEDAARAVIQTPRGPVEHASNQVGYFPRVHVPANTAIPVEVFFRNAIEGEAVVIGAEDGGKFEGDKRAIAEALEKNGRVAFTFHVLDHPGTYRVSLRRGAETKVLDFWVGPDMPLAER